MPQRKNIISNIYNFPDSGESFFPYVTGWRGFSVFSLIQGKACQPPGDFYLHWLLPPSHSQRRNNSNDMHILHNLRLTSTIRIKEPEAPTFFSHICQCNGSPCSILKSPCKLHSKILSKNATARGDVDQKSITKSD